MLISRVITRNYMNLKQKILDDFKKAFMEKNIERKNALAMLKSEISNREIELGKKEEGLSDEEVTEVVSRLVKQRKDSAEQFRSGQRGDLAQKEEAEAEILITYLPEQLSEEEIEETVNRVAEEISVKGKGDFGRLMGASMAKLKGKADGAKVKKAAEKIFAESHADIS